MKSNTRPISQGSPPEQETAPKHKEDEGKPKNARTPPPLPPPPQNKKTEHGVEGPRILDEGLQGLADHQREGHLQHQQQHHGPAELFSPWGFGKGAFATSLNSGSETPTGFQGYPGLALPSWKPRNGGCYVTRGQRGSLDLGFKYKAVRTPSGRCTKKSVCIFKQRIGFSVEP